MSTVAGPPGPSRPPGPPALPGPSGPPDASTPGIAVRGDRIPPPPQVDRRTDLRLLAPAALGWAVQALLLGSDTGWRVAVALVAVLVSAGVAWVARRQRSGSARDATSSRGVLAAEVLAAVALAAVVTLLLTGSLLAWTAVRDAGPVRELAEERAVVTVDAVVASDPRLVARTAGAGGRALVAVTLDARQVTGRGSTTRVQDPLLVLGDSTLLDLSWHEGVRVTGRLDVPDDPADDVVAILSPRGRATVLSPPGPVEQLAATVRSRFAAATSGLPADAAGLLPGLVLGDTSRSAPDLTAALQVSGLTHLSAVSGSNVSIVLAAALWGCGWAGVARRWRPFVAVLLLLGFVVLVRPEPSVLRAAAMGVVGLLGLSSHRRAEGLPAVGAAVVVLLAWDPWLSRSFGFALSTLATIALLLLARPWGEAISNRLPPRLSGLGPALAVPAAAQVVCGPVIVLLQGSVSLVAVPANLLAGPLVAPATILGVAVAAVAVVSTGAAHWLAWLPALPTLGVAAIARTGAHLPWGTVPWPTGTGGALSLALLSLLVVLTGPWVLHHGRSRPVVAGACALIGAAGVVPTAPLTWPPPGWRYVMCDVGQGDGMVLRSVTGTVIVVDAGPDPVAVDGCLRRLAVDHVDAVVLTHDHADHVDGLPGVLAGRTVGTILTDPVDDPPDRARDVSAEAAAARVPLAHLYAGDRLSWPGIEARVWWPARVIHAGSVPNNASVVLTVELDGLRLLLLGDVEREAAAEVLRALQADPAVLADGFDVVKVAHHGSANRDDALYAAAHAPLALVSVGAGNDYGHPAPSTVTTLRADGFRVLRTDQVGDIAVVGDPGTLQVATQRAPPSEGP